MIGERTPVPAIPVGAGNQEQYDAWNGEEGELWAAHAAFFDDGVRVLHRRLMQAAAVSPGERVLDIGCGTGQCTRDAARGALGGAATGIDLSLPMIRAAETAAREEGLTNATFVHGDAQVHRFRPAGFDVALSRTGAMFFADQGAAFANIGQALRPGGRLAMVSWRGLADNEWFIALRAALLPAAPASPPAGQEPPPFRHADRRALTALLTSSGFDHVVVEAVDAPIYFGRDAAAGFARLRHLFGWMVRDLGPEESERAMRRLHGLLRAHETADGVAFGSASWLVTARRR